jgi:hypothetical protein
MHKLGVAALVFVVVRSWGFVWLPLLLKPATVLNIRFAKLSELFIELQHYFGPLSD